MLTYYSLRIGLVLAAVVPLRLGYWLCSLIGTIAFYTNGAARRAVQDNLRHVLGPRASRREINRVGRSVCRNTVKNHYELLCIPRFTKADLEKRVEIRGIEYIDEALRQGKGAILCTGHIGNFNLMAQMAAARGYPCTIVAEHISPPPLHDLVNGLRSRFGLKMLPLGTSAIRGIYHLVRANELLGLAADRDVSESGIPVEFFGEVTELPSGPAALAMRLNTPLLLVQVRRTANDSSIITIFPPLQFERSGDRERDVRLGTEQIVRALEEMIRQAPDQWVVLQPVWRDPPAAPPLPVAAPPAAPAERPAAPAAAPDTPVAQPPSAISH